jgi:cell filamentation protein, protein adenylyltransferase
MNSVNPSLYKRILEKKIRIDSYPPLHPDLEEQIRQKRTIEYIHSSNAIEGNTLSLGETAAAINGETIKGKTIKEFFEANNHPAAINYIQEQAKKQEPITEETIKHIHRLLMNQLLHEPGAYRTGAARIAGAHIMPPKSTEIPEKMHELLEWLNTNPYEYPPIELSARFMHRFLAIHPFQDGNGRTARLLMNQILMQHGYPVLTNISIRDRKKYLETLRETDHGDPEPLINLVAMSVEDNLTKHIIAVEEIETLSLREAAQKSPYTAEYLGLRARDGSLGAYKEGRNWRTTREDLEQYIQKNK